MHQRRTIENYHRYQDHKTAKLNKPISSKTNIRTAQWKCTPSRAGVACTLSSQASNHRHRLPASLSSLASECPETIYFGLRSSRPLPKKTRKEIWLASKYSTMLGPAQIPTPNSQQSTHPAQRQSAPTNHLSSREEETLLAIFEVSRQWGLLTPSIDMCVKVTAL